MNWEEIYCQAERDYDAMKEEKLLESVHTADEQKDMSQCHDFHDRVLRYASNAVLKEFQGMIIDELNRRPGAYDYPIGDQVRADFAKKVQEIEDMKEPF